MIPVTERNLRAVVGVLDWRRQRRMWVGLVRVDRARFVSFASWRKYVNGTHALYVFAIRQARFKSGGKRSP